MPVWLIKDRTRPWAQAHMAIIGNNGTKGPTHPHLLARRTISNRHITQRWAHTAAQIRVDLSVVTRTVFRAWECLRPQDKECMVRMIFNYSPLTGMDKTVDCLSVEQPISFVPIFLQHLR
jgi:hypothetical protein